MAFSFGAVLSLKDNFTSKIKSATQENEKLKKSIKGATSELNKMESSSNSFKSIKNNANGSIGALKSLGLAVAGVVGGYQALNATLGEAMKQEVNKVTVEALFKGDNKTANEYFDYLNKSAAESAFSVNDFMSAGKTLVPLTKDVGLLKEMTKVTETLAMTNPAQGFEGASIAMRELMSGDITSIVERFNLSRGMANQIKNAGTLQEKTDLLKSSLAEMGYNQQFMDRVNETSYNKWQKFLDNVKLKLVDVGSKILDKLKPSIDSLTKTMENPAFDNFVNKLGTGIANAVGFTINLFTLLGGAVKWASDNSSWLIPVLSGVAGALMALKIINTVKGWMVAWQGVTKGMTLAQLALNFAMSANPLGLVVIGIGIAIAAGVALWKNWDTVRAKATALWEKIKKVWTDIRNLFKNPLKGVVNLFQRNKSDNGVDGSHYNGLTRVPFNGYIAELHKDEAVIPARQNPYNVQNNSNNKAQNNINININGVGLSIDEIMAEFVPRLKLTLSNM